MDYIVAHWFEWFLLFGVGLLLMVTRDIEEVRNMLDNPLSDWNATIPAQEPDISIFFDTFLYVVGRAIAYIFGFLSFISVVAVIAE